MNRVFGTPKLQERQLWWEDIKQQRKKTTERFQLQLVTQLLLWSSISQLVLNCECTAQLEKQCKCVCGCCWEHTRAVLLLLYQEFPASVSLRFLVPGSTNQLAIRDLVSHRHPSETLFFSCEIRYLFVASCAKFSIISSLVWCLYFD